MNKALVALACTYELIGRIGQGVHSGELVLTDTDAKLVEKIHDLTHKLGDSLAAQVPDVPDGDRPDETKEPKALLARIVLEALRQRRKSSPEPPDA